MGRIINFQHKGNETKCRNTADQKARSHVKILIYNATNMGHTNNSTPELLLDCSPIKLM